MLTSSCGEVLLKFMIFYCFLESSHGFWFRDFDEERQGRNSNAGGQQGDAERGNWLEHNGRRTAVRQWTEKVGRKIRLPQDLFISFPNFKTPTRPIIKKLNPFPSTPICKLKKFWSRYDKRENFLSILNQFRKKSILRKSGKNLTHKKLGGISLFDHSISKLNSEINEVS